MASFGGDSVEVENTSLQLVTRGRDFGTYFSCSASHASASARCSALDCLDAHEQWNTGLLFPENTTRHKNIKK